MFCLSGLLYSKKGRGYSTVSVGKATYRIEDLWKVLDGNVEEENDNGEEDNVADEVLVIRTNTIGRTGRRVDLH